MNRNENKTHLVHLPRSLTALFSISWRKKKLAHVPGEQVCPHGCTIARVPAKSPDLSKVIAACLFS